MTKICIHVFILTHAIYMILESVFDYTEPLREVKCVVIFKMCRNAQN